MRAALVHDELLQEAPEHRLALQCGRRWLERQNREPRADSQWIDVGTNCLASQQKRKKRAQISPENRKMHMKRNERETKELFPIHKDHEHTPAFCCSFSRWTIFGTQN